MDIFAPSHLLILLLIILVIFGPAKLGDVGGAPGSPPATILRRPRNQSSGAELFPFKPIWGNLNIWKNSAIPLALQTS